eukprot:328274-Pleurochrysis_carterae.AAC.2
MHSSKSSITLRTANHSASLCAECTQITPEILHQNKPANSCCNKELGSRQSHHTCHDRMERANGNRANGQRYRGKTGDLKTASFILVGYHLKLSTDVSSLLPLREEPNQTPWFRFAAVVPSCAGVRPIGYRVFPKIYLQPNMLSPQSIPCVYLGRARNQPGHMCLDPLT